MLSRRSLAVFLLSSLAAAAVSLGRVADAPAADGGPATFISKVGQEAINSLTGRQLSDEEREDRFRKILNRSFKVDLIARFTLGRYWRLATEQQKKEYARLFEDFIDGSYMIVDVLVEGVSMAITQRDEFAAIINQSGGKVEGLLTALRQKTGK